MAHRLLASGLGSRISVMSELAGIFWSVIGDFSVVLKVTNFVLRGRDMWR